MWAKVVDLVTSEPSIEKYESDCSFIYISTYGRVFYCSNYMSLRSRDLELNIHTVETRNQNS